MPLRFPTVPKSWKFAIVAICLVLGVALTWYSFQGHRTLFLTVAYLILVSVLIGTKIIEVPQSISVPFLGIWPRLSDVVKGVACMSVGMLWAPIAIRLVPETPTGLAIVVVPSGVLILAAAFFLLKSFLGNLK